jgi:hypothetical protein
VRMGGWAEVAAVALAASKVMRGPVDDSWWPKMSRSGHHTESAHPRQR